MRRTETKSEQRRALRVVDDACDAARGVTRPRTRGDCVDAPRPCPFVGCRHHLAINVNESNGTIWFPWGFDAKDGVPLDAMPETCALDVADEERERDRAEVAALLNLSNDMIAVVEDDALAKLRPRMRGHR